MSSNYFDPDWTAKVTIPVKRVGERWEFFYGGDVPVKEGTLGMPTFSVERISDGRLEKPRLSKVRPIKNRDLWRQFCRNQEFFEVPG